MVISVTELFSASLKLYKKNIWSFIQYMFLMIAPTAIAVGIIWIIISLQFDNLIIKAQTEGLQAVLFSTPNITSFILMILAGLITIPIQLGYMKFIYARYVSDASVTLYSSLKEMALSYMKNLYAIIVFSIIIGGPYYAGIIGAMVSKNLGITSLTLVALVMTMYGFFHAIYFGIKYLFALFEVIFNNRSIGEALKTSAKLSQGRWWAILGRLVGSTLLVILIIIGLMLATTVVLGLISLMFGETGSVIVELLLGAIQVALQFCLTPILITLPIILYHNITEQKLLPKEPPVDDEPHAEIPAV